jgi:hypothetical protein
VLSATTGELCVLTPIRPGREEPLRAELRALPDGRHSPFARIEATHYARWTIVPNLEHRGRRRSEGQAYLLFAGEFDGSAEDFLRAIRTRMARESESIWGNCEGYEPVAGEGFARYLLAHRLTPPFSFVSYPGAPVGAALAALHLRERLTGLSIHAPDLDPAALKQAWLEAFGQVEG